MTKDEFYLKRAKLLMQIDDAKKLDCKNVIKHSELALTKLENKFKKEHLCNPLFSYFATSKEVDTLIEQDAKPTFVVRVEFKGGETCDMMFYHTIKKGVRHQAIEEWAEKQMASSIIHPENIKSVHLVIGLFNN